MLLALLRLLFGCKHEFGFPVTDPGSYRTYQVCVRCGVEYEYDWDRSWANAPVPFQGQSQGGAMTAKNPNPISVALTTHDAERLRRLAASASTNEGRMALKVLSDMLDRQVQAQLDKCAQGLRKPPGGRWTP